MNRKLVLKLIVAPVILFLFLSLFNLRNQYTFKDDPARDTLQSLRILNNREVTLIGPPLSLGQYGLRETYFSSAIYYIGALGLFLGNTSPIAPVAIIALINASGIIPLVLLLRQRKYKDHMITLITLLYVTSPIVINYSRILWNPSPLIGLGLWGIYAFTLSPVLFGLIGGLSIYFHYFAGVFLATGIFIQLVRKKWKYILSTSVALALSLIPFLFFEMRNEFYLTKSLIYNVQNTQAGAFLESKLQILLTIPTTLLGLSSDFFGTRLLDVTSFATVVGLFSWLGYIKYRKKSLESLFFILAAILTLIASKDVVRMQYIFIGIGALLAYGIPKKLGKTGKYIVVLIILVQAINTLYSISHPAHAQQESLFPSISQFEQAEEAISEWHEPGKKFNVTENITGDARARHLRFFIESSQGSIAQDLQDELTYENLDELYVLTPSIEKTLQERRWEFGATKNLELKNTKSIGTFILLHYIHTNPASK